MPTFSAKDIIGKNLVAKKQLTAFYGNPNSNKVFIVMKGNTVGEVFSWIVDKANGNQLWWEFMDGGLFGKGAYFVKHDPTAFDYDVLTNQGVQSDAEKKAAADEAKKKEDEGAFAYYVEKWGKPVLGLTVFTILAVEGIKYYNNKK